MKIEKVLLWENREDVVLVSYVLEENKEKLNPKLIKYLKKKYERVLIIY